MMKNTSIWIVYIILILFQKRNNTSSAQLNSTNYYNNDYDMFANNNQVINSRANYYSKLIESKNKNVVFRGPSLCSSDDKNFFIRGYTNLRRLMLDISAASAASFESMSNEFILCPGSTFNISSGIGGSSKSNSEGEIPLLLPYDNIILSCGETGSIEDNKCTISDGLVHMILTGNNLTLNGITFLGSRGASILAVGESFAHATFNNCVWKDNMGHSAVFIQHVDDSVLAESISNPEILENIMVDEGDLSSPDESFAPDYQPGMSLFFSNCVFKKNPLESIVIHSKYATVELSKVLFEKNGGNVASIFVAHGSSLIVTDSCFLNERNKLYANIYIDNNSTLVEEKNYQYGTKGGLDCDSVLYEDLTCVPFTSEVCQVNNKSYGEVVKEEEEEVVVVEEKVLVEEEEVPKKNNIFVRGPGVCPTNSAVTGYSNIRRMVFDMKSVSSLPSGSGYSKTFILCPDTVYDITNDFKTLSSSSSSSSAYSMDVMHRGLKGRKLAESYTKDIPVLIPSNDIVLKCGADGSIDSNCTFRGGLSHMLIGGSNITISGFTFEGSEGVSILALGEEGNYATFKDCNWKKNLDAYAAALLMHGESESIEDAISDTALLDSLLLDVKETLSIYRADPETRGMTVSFDGCRFNKNIFRSSIIYAIASKVKISSSKFRLNKVQDADIILTKEGECTLDRSCFLGNDKEKKFGRVFVSNDSLLTEENTFGETEVATQYNCSDIFLEGQNSKCLIGKRCADYACADFSSSMCVSDITVTPKEIVSIPTETPTETPTILTTSSPIETPTTLATPMPTARYINYQATSEPILNVNSSNSTALPTSTPTIILTLFPTDFPLYPLLSNISYFATGSPTLMREEFSSVSLPNEAFSFFRGPSQCPSNTSEYGYSDVRRLLLDMEAIETSTIGTPVYTICANTIMTISKSLSVEKEGSVPIIIPFDDVTISCGADGSSSNNCTISGGLAHVLVSGKNLTMNGITFEGSSGVSIMAIGPKGHDITFNNCIWKINNGYGLIYNQYDSKDTLKVALKNLDALDDLLINEGESLAIPPVTDEGMQIFINSCKFKSNNVTAALVYCGNSSILFDETRFEDNVVMVADIVLNNNSTAVIRSSCFINDSSNFGAIYVSKDSTLINDQNYAMDKYSKSGCIIFKEGDESCLSKDLADCNDYQCGKFFASTCQINDEEDVQSEISPTKGPDSTSPMGPPQPEVISSSTRLSLQYIFLFTFIASSWIVSL